MCVPGNKYADFDYGHAVVGLSLLFYIPLSLLLNLFL